jgi:hypothetical protein
VHGDHSRVEDCTVFGCGGHGISITAGDVHTLRKGNTSAVGNMVTDYSRIVRTYQVSGLQVQRQIQRSIQLLTAV